MLASIASFHHASAAMIQPVWNGAIALCNGYALAESAEEGPFAAILRRLAGENGHDGTPPPGITFDSLPSLASKMAEVEFAGDEAADPEAADPTGSFKALLPLLETLGLALPIPQPAGDRIVPPRIETSEVAALVPATTPPVTRDPAIPADTAAAESPVSTDNTIATGKFFFAGQAVVEYAAGKRATAPVGRGSLQQNTVAVAFISAPDAGAVSTPEAGSIDTRSIDSFRPSVPSQGQSFATQLLESIATGKQDGGRAPGNTTAAAQQVIATVSPRNEHAVQLEASALPTMPPVNSHCVIAQEEPTRVAEHVEVAAMQQTLPLLSSRNTDTANGVDTASGDAPPHSPSPAIQQAVTGFSPRNEPVSASTEMSARLTQSVGAAGWSEEVGNRLVWMANRMEGKAELVLTPPQMGRIEVTLSVSGEQATASFVSGNAAVREALEAALPRLREVLAEAGVQLGQAQVGAENTRQPAQQEKNADNFGLGRTSRSDNAPVGSGPLPAGSGLKGGRSLVDIYA